MNNSSSRRTEYDLLRVIAAFSVILMHVTVWDLYTLPLESGEWVQTTIVNAVSHFGVPVFVMISGALFLDPSREVDIKRLWIHNILRLIIILTVWNIFYGLTDYLEYKAEPVYLVREIINGRNHLWFLPMIIGLYVIQPLLLRWIKNAEVKEVRYFLAVFFVVGVLWETLKALELSGVITNLDEYRNIPLVSSYVGYFVAGYYIVHVGIPDRTRRLIIACGGICCILSPVLTVFFSRAKGTAWFSLTDSFSVLTFVYSLAVFCLVTNGSKEKESSSRFGKIMTEFGKDTFGVYLCHIFLIERLAFLRIVYKFLPIIPAIILYAIILFVIGTLISALLRRIPVAGRYIC
ncbi:MAG: acyltransferase family protein [Lachnospiraceae bacterium]|nr:acyltransferase family protein [Lachnospiraceae bacterium]